MTRTSTRIKLLCLGFALASGGAVAALDLTTDFAAPEPGVVRVSCNPDPAVTTCDVEILRIRRPSDAAIAAALAAGTDGIPPLRLPVAKRLILKSQVATFVAATTPAP